MNSESLYQLFQPLDTLKGIGPKLKSRLKYLVGNYVIDLIWHLPNGFIDRSYRPNINDAEDWASSLNSMQSNKTYSIIQKKHSL